MNTASKTSSVSPKNLGQRSPTFAALWIGNSCGGEAGEGEGGSFACVPIACSNGALCARLLIHSISHDPVTGHTPEVGDP